MSSPVPQVPAGSQPAALWEDDASITKVSSIVSQWFASASTTSLLSNMNLPSSSSPPEEAIRLMFKRTHKDIAFNKTRSSSIVLDVNVDTGSLRSSPVCAAFDASPALSFSPSGRLYAVMKKDTVTGDASNKQRPVIEVWEACSGSLLKVISLEEKGGEAMSGGEGWFTAPDNNLTWSGDEKYVCFVAEAKAETIGDPLFDPAGKASKKGKGEERGGEERGGEEKGGEGGKGTSTKSLRSSAFDYDLGGGFSASSSRESWGEKYEGVRQPVCCVVGLDSGYIGVFPAASDAAATPCTSSLGQPTWLTVGSGDGASRQLIAYTRWRHEPRRLGMIYCYNRPCDIQVADVTQWLQVLDSGSNTDGVVIPHVRVSGPEKIARSPRWICNTRQGNTVAQLAFLTVTGSGELTHNAACGMVVTDIEVVPGGVDGRGEVRGGEGRGVADIVQTPSIQLQQFTVKGQEASQAPLYPGVYCHLIPSKQLSVQEDGFVFLTLLIRSQHRIAAVDVRTPCSTPGSNVYVFPAIAPAGVGPSPSFSNALLSVGRTPSGRTYIVGATSSPTRPDSYFLLVRSDASRTSPWNVHYLPAADGKLAQLLASDTPSEPFFPRPVLDGVRRLTWSYVDVSSTYGDAGDAFILLPGGMKGLPLVVVPHGGPHSTFTADYLTSYACLAALGTAALPGKAGKLDIDDVYAAAQAALTHYGDAIDGHRVGIMGGSHGGFIASHSLGQYPGFYKTAVLRNPVTNIASMLSTTDIPDWCITEACGLEAMADWSGVIPVPSADLLARLLAASPIAHVSKVTAPVLFTLGMKDKRVPASQGIEFNYALRARGIPTRVLAYPEDVHALDRVATEGDAWTNIILWLATHLRIPLPA